MTDVVPPKIYDILNSVVNKDIKNYSIRLHNPNRKGDGFMGQMFYVSLTDNSGQVSEYVVKQAFEDEKIRALQPIREYFVNEINFYSRVWPRLQQLERETQAKPFDKIPKCFATSSVDKNEKLVLENLKLQNFETFDKKRALDEEHVEFICKQYGRFHAISFAYKLFKPQEYSKISNELKELWCTFCNTQAIQRIIKSIHEFCLKNFDEVEDAKVIQKYKHYVDDGVEIYRNSNIYKGNYSAILHGDCWSNNMMFKYDESGNVTDIRLLDFQFAKEGTPVSDLSYCLYSGAPKEILGKLDYYLKVYHNSLSETLKEFGCNPDEVYPFQELKNDWKQYCKTGFTLGLFIWRLKLTHENDVIDLTDRGKNSEKTMVTTQYDEEAFKIRSRDLILHMYENDFF